MSEKNLSQEEIEMLLRSQDLTGAAAEESPRDAVTGQPEAKPQVPVTPQSQERLPEKSTGAPQVPAEEYNPPFQDFSGGSNVRPVVFEELKKEPSPREPVSGMDMLMDIPLSVSVELGKTKCYVKDLLNLTSGSILELDRLAGDPVDILVNGKPFAKGEVVVIDENFGVRIREILANQKKR